MNILSKLQDKDARFEELKGVFGERQANIKAIQDEANRQISLLNAESEQITDEMKRVQGEYRLLVELGKETGVLDEEGKPVVAEPAEDAAASEESAEEK